MTNKCKIFFGNQHIKTIEVDGKRYTRGQAFRIKSTRMIKRILTTGALTVGVAWIAVGFLHIGLANARTVQVEKEVVKEVRSVPPILKRIMECESGYKHYDKSGQVLTRGNKNLTVDTGIAQINTVWHKTASGMKLDITKEEDNIQFAIWLFDNYGSEPWYSSKNCWSK